MAAEINQTIEDQNKRPRKTFITPTAKSWLCHVLQRIAKAH
jgi:hypothetical protein